MSIHYSPSEKTATWMISFPTLHVSPVNTSTFEGGIALELEDKFLTELKKRHPELKKILGKYTSQAGRWVRQQKSRGLSEREIFEGHSYERAKEAIDKKRQQAKQRARKGKLRIGKR